MRFFLNWLLTSIAIAVAAFIVPGIQPFGTADPWLSPSWACSSGSSTPW